MNCRRAKDLLPLAAGGDLDSKDQARVDAHVATCLSCFRDMQRFRTALAPLRDLRENGRVPKDLLCDVLSAVDAARESAVPAGPVMLPLRGSLLRRAASIAAVVILGVVAGAHFADRRSDPSGRSGVPTHVASGSPFDRIQQNVQNVSYPIRRDVFGGASPVLLPAVATPAYNAFPTDDFFVRIRRSQPNPAVMRSNSQADGF